MLSDIYSVTTAPYSYLPPQHPNTCHSLTVAAKFCPRPTASMCPPGPQAFLLILHTVSVAVVESSAQCTVQARIRPWPKRKEPVHVSEKATQSCQGPARCPQQGDGFVSVVSG